MSELHSLLDATRDAVAQASVVCRAVQRDLNGIRSITKDDKSPVTIADFASQAIVAKVLRDRLGSVILVGEEGSATLRQPEYAGHLQAVVDAARLVWNDATTDDVLAAIDLGDARSPGASGAFWTLDPIDGTKGFLRGEQYAVSLAYILDGKVLVGGLGCPNLSLDFARSFDDPDPRGSIYLAAKGMGVLETTAELDHADPKKITRPAFNPATGIRACESVESAHSDHSASHKILAHAGGAGEPAKLDSQAKYAVVARGQADAYLRMPTKKGYVEKIWDHAAGAIVASEAGCAVSDITGAPLDFGQGEGLSNNRGIVCAAPGVQPRLVSAIRELGLASAGM
ncbi:MAG: 3'(2'),5'-bisphosphate nucleotidase [Phycisphaeraceae bacterium]|nr:3'(2'),5'-bisphosphate nucleotidase [Phycisphaeraceae bacterium]